MPCLAQEVILGVDTHVDTHTAALIDPLGRLVASGSFPASARGHRALLAWAQRHGTLRRTGVEGTGSYGVGLARLLDLEGVEVIEVTRAARKDRRHLGKSDPVDAEAAARVVLSEQASAIPKTRGGVVESIWVLRLTCHTAVKARTQAVLQIRTLIVSAPDRLREELIALKPKKAAERCLALRPGPGHDALDTIKRALRALARRHRPGHRDRRARGRVARAHRTRRPAAARSAQRRARGRRQATYAGRRQPLAPARPRRAGALCGASPVEASSGKTRRHRLNRGRDRQANNALYTIAMVGMQHHPETRVYVERRTAQGKSRREIRRCLMRTLARRLYPLLLADLHDAKKLPAPLT